MKVSDVYKEFLHKHSLIKDKSTRIHIEKSFQDLRGSGILDILSLAKELRKDILNVSISYDFFVHYSLIGNAKDLIEKIAQIKNIKNYVKKVASCQDEMKDILINKNSSILMDDYLKLLNILNSRKSINEKINNNKDYSFLYGR